MSLFTYWISSPVLCFNSFFYFHYFIHLEPSFELVDVVACFSCRIWQHCATVSATHTRQCETQDGAPLLLDCNLNKLLSSDLKPCCFISLFFSSSAASPTLFLKVDYDTKRPKLPESASWTRTKIISHMVGVLLVLFFFIKQKSKIQACIDRHFVWKVNYYLQVAFRLETAIWLQHFENYARERQFALIQPLTSFSMAMAAEAHGYCSSLLFGAS